MIGLIDTAKEHRNKERVIIIGLTGGIGSGKSSASKIFSDLGAYIIDADKISHEVMQKGADAYSEVSEFFGSGILNADKSIDRKALAAIVFSDKSKLDLLNKITHKYIFAEMQRRIDEYRNSYSCGVIILDVPLLFSSDFPIECDKTIAVTAKDKVKIKRVTERDNCTEEQVKERMNNQLSDERMKELADYSIDNSGDFDALQISVKNIYGELIKYCCS